MTTVYENVVGMRDDAIEIRDMYAARGNKTAVAKWNARIAEHERQIARFDAAFDPSQPCDDGRDDGEGHE